MLAFSIFTLTACGTSGGAADNAAPPASPTVTATAEVSESAAGDEPTEGIESPAPTTGSVTTPAGRTFTTPEGIDVEFRGAKLYTGKQVQKIIPGSYNVEKGDGPDVLPDQVAVKVTLRLKNPGPQPLKFDGMNVFMQGRYGSSQYDAETVNWVGDEVLAMDPVPNQVGPGASTDVWATFKVPKAELESFTITPSDAVSSTEFTFTDVGKVAR